MLGHLSELHRFYGEQAGVRVARKHLTWYCDKLAGADDFRYQAVRVDSASEQIRLTQEFFGGPKQNNKRRSTQGTQEQKTALQAH